MAEYTEQEQMILRAMNKAFKASMSEVIYFLNEMAIPSLQEFLEGLEDYQIRISLEEDDVHFVYPNVRVFKYGEGFLNELPSNVEVFVEEKAMLIHEIKERFMEIYGSFVDMVIDDGVDVFLETSDNAAKFKLEILSTLSNQLMEQIEEIKSL